MILGMTIQANDLFHKYMSRLDTTEDDSNVDEIWLHMSGSGGIACRWWFLMAMCLRLKDKMGFGLNVNSRVYVA